MTATRSGWLTYAAVMMFVAAGFSAIWAVNLWSDAAWLANVSDGVLGNKHWLWGFVDAGLVVLFALAGKSLLEGRSFGRWVASWLRRSAACVGSTGCRSRPSSR